MPGFYNDHLYGNNKNNNNISGYSGSPGNKSGYFQDEKHGNVNMSKNNNNDDGNNNNDVKMNRSKT